MGHNYNQKNDFGHKEAGRAVKHYKWQFMQHNGDINNSACILGHNWILMEHSLEINRIQIDIMEYSLVFDVNGIQVDTMPRVFFLPGFQQFALKLQFNEMRYQ